VLRLLTFSTLYPNAIEPQHGIFVEQRLRHFLNDGDADDRSSLVVAPVPWFPLSHPAFGRYGSLASVPPSEQRHGIPVLHPRYPVLPKIGTSVAPFLMAAALRPTLRRLVAGENDFDLIDAHYLYPDGVAAVMLGRALRKPVTITARGSDVNLLGQDRWPRRLICRAVRRAHGTVTVSAALKARLVGWGADERRITVLPNGVDLSMFRPLDREQARRALGLAPPLLVYVGRLTALKGIDLALRALQELPAMRLVLVGGGEQERPLKQLAARLAVADRVTFAGPVPQERLASYYSAADATILMSSREGWPNVLLESMACGTPVAATDVGGVPEIVATPEAGVLVQDRSAGGLHRALRRLLDDPPDRTATRRYAERFGWETTTRGMMELFDRALADRIPA
jgi:glycosyltransferase involved in cell wall biosynthesis